MGIFSAVFERRDLGYNDPKAYDTSLWNLYGWQSKTGVTVTEETALNFSAVFNAINLIAGDVGKLPLFVYKRLERGKAKALDHYLYDLLHRKPNPEMPKITFWEVMTAHLLAWGNCYAQKVQDFEGKIRELWPIPPHMVRIIRENGTRKLIYEISMSNGQKLKLGRENILHIPGLGYNGIQGYSVIMKARESIGLGMATEEFGARFFGEGTNPGIVVKHPGRLGPEGHDNLSNELRKAYTGLSKTHKLMLLEEGMTVEKIAIPPDDAQFLETRKFQIEEIARWFNIPLHKLKELTHATFSNIEHQSIEYVTDTLQPWLTRIEQHLSLQLLKDGIEARQYFFEHLVEGLLRGDAEARSNFYNRMFQVGALSINDILEKENMNPIDDPVGDERFVPLNMQPLSMMGKEPMPIKEPTGEPEPEEDLEKEPTEEEQKKWRNWAIEERQKRSATARRRLVESYHRLFRDAAQALVNRETIAIRRAATSQLKERSVQDFNKWLDEFYREFPQYVRKKFLALLLTFAEAMQAEAAGEIGAKVEMTPELEQFVEEYLDGYTNRHISSSLGQIREMMAEVTPEELEESIKTRIDEWSETRSEKIAKNETVRSSNAITRYVWLLAGVTYLVWRAQGGKSCPYCQELDGKVVGIDKAFISEGSFRPSGADGPMEIKGNHFHPPLHNGCVCMITVR